MDLLKWFTVTTLCALMLMFDAVLHDDACDFIHLFDMRRMALLFVINIRNFAYCHGINRHAKLFFKVTNICVKESVLLTAMKRSEALWCVWFVSFIYVAWNVRLLLDDHIVQPSVYKLSYVVNSTTSEGARDSIHKHVLTAWRSEGEDMEMVCVNVASKGTWLFNGEPVNESFRRYSFPSDTRNGSLHFVRVHSLQHGDFGTYSFVVPYLNTTAYMFAQNGVIRNRFVLWSTLCEYILLEYVQRVEKVMVPHGGLFVAQFSYSSLNDDEYLYVDVTVNEESVELVCDQCQEDCSSFLRYFVEDTRTHVRHREVEIYHLKFVHVISQICMCPKAFGNYSVSYFRRHFNHEKGIFELIEIQNTKTYILEPLRSPFLNWIIDAFGWEKPAAGSTTMNEYTLEEMCLYSKAVELGVCIFLVVLFFIPTCLTILYFMGVLHIIIQLYMLHMSINTSKRNKPRTTQTYMLCCEEDTQWSAMNADPVIKAVGHATYIHCRDSHPGQTDLEGIRTGMRMCQTFVIVESQCAIQDPMWVYQVDVVLDRLVRREVPPFNVLVVRLDGARHPELEEVTRVRTIRTIVWEEGNSEDQYVQARRKDVMCWLFACDPHLYLENV